jgi:hypothetical protein
LRPSRFVAFSVLYATVQHVADELDRYVHLRTGDSDRVALAGLVDSKGDVNGDARDVIALSLVNVEEERIGRSMERYERTDDDRVRRIEPEIRLNLYLLFVANFTDHAEALKAVDEVVSYFQNTPFVEYADIEESDRSGRVVFELVTLTFEQINHLWGALGAKYMPSVLYKARLTTVDDAQPQPPRKPVIEIERRPG